MARKLYILGGSGIGMIAASIVSRQKVCEVAGFLNDVIPVGSEIGKYKKHKVVGTTKDLSRLMEDPEAVFFIAYVGLSNEKTTYEKVSALNISEEKLLSIVDETALIPDGYCQIGRGVLISPYCQLSPDVTIGDNCILLPNSFVGHDSTLEHFAHIATNSVIGANVVVGKGVHVGSNATVREKVHIGDYSLVGAGSVVLNDVEENSVVVGNPARILRSRGRSS